jgi:hypothetical protein
MNRPNNRRASTSETWLEVVAAVDYLSRGHRRGFGVWDAVEEALRWYTAHLVAGDDAALAASAAAELPWDDPDPLRTALERFVVHHPTPAEAEETSSDAIHAALSDWLRVMAHEYNDDCRFAPALRVGAIPARLQSS